MSKNTLSQTQRFRLLELLLIWEGSVQRKKIAESFDIALNHVTNVIREYECLCPDNLKYDQRKRRYLAGEKFKPKFCKGSPQEYLGMLKGQLYGMKDMSLSVDVLSYCYLIPEPEQKINASVLRTLVSAILNGKQVKVSYQSLTEGTPSSRIVSPHSLINSGYRWHARAFDHTREAYRDFVLHRILTIELAHGQKAKVPTDDGWNNDAVLIIIPNPLASDGQKEVIAKEYGMKKIGREWRWDISVKRCLVPYVVKYMRLDEIDKSVFKAPIVLKNIDEVGSLLKFPQFTGH